jgi:hypothetical protein
MSFIKLLFWIFLIYIIIRLVRFSFYFGKIHSQVKKNFQYPHEEPKSEGTTTIKYVPENNKKKAQSNTTHDHDYIDYEEVK